MAAMKQGPKGRHWSTFIDRLLQSQQRSHCLTWRGLPLANAHPNQMFHHTTVPVAYDAVLIFNPQLLRREHSLGRERTKTQ